MSDRKSVETIRCCPHCKSEAVEKSGGDEGWTFCSGGCGCIEGDKTVDLTPEEFEAEHG